MLLFLKQCSICDAPKSRNKHKSESPQHNIYVQNHDGPSKTMESHAIHNRFIEILVGRKGVDKNSCEC